MNKVIATFLLLIISSFLSICYASDAQPCNKQIAQLVGKHFNIDRFWSHYYNDLDPASIRGDNDEEPGVIWGNACKMWPYDKNKTIATFFYVTSADDSWGKVVVAIMENNHVVASYKDKSDRWLIDRIRIDTARYDIAKGKRAFGLDFSDSYRANCGDGGIDWRKILFVINDSSVVPVTHGLALKSWKFEKGGNPRCGAIGTTVIRTTNSFISVGEEENNGLANLIVTKKSTYDNDPEYVETSKLKLLFNGREYIGSVMPSFDCKKASTSMETMICDNKNLSRLDSELSVAYKKVLRYADQPQAIKQTQRQWLKSRNECKDYACVAKAYISRLKALVALSEKQKEMNLSQEDKDIALFKATRAGDKTKVEALLAKGANLNAVTNNGTPLYEAASRSNKDMVKFLIAKGADVNAKRHSRAVPLLAVAREGDKEIALLLLANGANVNGVDYIKVTPLHSAAVERHKEMVALLIDHGANVNANRGAGNTPFHYAAMGGDKEIMEMMIAKGADIHARSPGGFTALHRAVVSDRKEAIELLITKGVDIDARDQNLRTALHWAASRGHKDAVDILIANGADVNARKYRGETPLALAIKNKHNKLADFLRAKEAVASVSSGSGQSKNVKAIFQSVRNRDKAAVEVLLAKGVDVNSNELGRPLLHQAALLGDEKIVALLLAKGANPSTIDKRGATSIHVAALKGRKDIVELLLSRNVDINAKTDKGWTPLHRAIAERHTELVKLLLARGADINARETRNLTPLHFAAGSLDQELFKLMLSKKAEVNAQGLEGDTPLHSAVNADNRANVALLLENGADINALNRMGSPLHVAAHRISAFQKDPDMLEFLVAKGADVNLKNMAGETVLQKYLARGKEEIVKLLKAHGAKE